MEQNLCISNFKKVSCNLHRRWYDYSANGHRSIWQAEHFFDMWKAALRKSNKELQKQRNFTTIIKSILFDNKSKYTTGYVTGGAEVCEEKKIRNVGIENTSRYFKPCDKFLVRAYMNGKWNCDVDATTKRIRKLLRLFKERIEVYKKCMNQLKKRFVVSEQKSGRTIGTIMWYCSRTNATPNNWTQTDGKCKMLLDVDDKRKSIIY